jgi:hypothetical protein
VQITGGRRGKTGDDRRGHDSSFFADLGRESVVFTLC